MANIWSAIRNMSDTAHSCSPVAATAFFSGNVTIKTAGRWPWQISDLFWERAQGKESQRPRRRRRPLPFAVKMELLLLFTNGAFHYLIYHITFTIYPREWERKRAHKPYSLSFLQVTQLVSLLWRSFFFISKQWCPRRFVWINHIHAVHHLYGPKWQLKDHKQV